jgi:IclR family acetate operon transcriptional repressor
VADLRRAKLLLEVIAKGRGTFTLTDLAVRTGLPRSSVHRLLRTLEEEQFIASDPKHSQYALGPALLEFGLSAHIRLIKAHRPHLLAMSQRVCESVDLAILDGGDVVVVDQVDSRQRPSASRIGRRLPLHASSFGKALMSLLPNDELDRSYLSRPLQRVTPNAPTDHVMLKSELDAVRKVGIAVDIDGVQQGFSGIATATKHFGVMQAIAVIMPTRRLRQKAPLAIDALQQFNPLIDAKAARRLFELRISADHPKEPKA